MNSVFPIEGITKTPSYRWRDYSRVKKNHSLMTTKYAELCHYFQVQTLTLTHSWELRASSLVATTVYSLLRARAQCGALPALRA